MVDQVHAGRLDEAEQAARELLVRYPEVHDGYDRLGMDYDPEFVASFLDLINKLEASAAEGCGVQRRGPRGPRPVPRGATDCYRKVIEFALAHPEVEP